MNALDVTLNIWDNVSSTSKFSSIEYKTLRVKYYIGVNHIAITRFQKSMNIN